MSIFVLLIGLKAIWNIKRVRKQTTEWNRFIIIYYSIFYFPQYWRLSVNFLMMQSKYIRYLLFILNLRTNRIKKFIVIIILEGIYELLVMCTSKIHLSTSIASSVSKKILKSINCNKPTMWSLNVVKKTNDRHAQIILYENAFKNHLKIGFRLFK